MLDGGNHPVETCGNDCSAWPASLRSSVHSLSSAVNQQQLYKHLLAGSESIALT